MMGVEDGKGTWIETKKEKKKTKENQRRAESRTETVCSYAIYKERERERGECTMGPQKKGQESERRAIKMKDREKGKN